jgi:hypothetical protein
VWSPWGSNFRVSNSGYSGGVGRAGLTAGSRMAGELYTSGGIARSGPRPAGPLLP